MAPPERFVVEPPLIRADQPLSPGVPVMQGEGEARFLNHRVPQQYFAALDLEAAFWPFSRSSFDGSQTKRGDQGGVSAGCDGGFLTKRICFFASL